MKTSLASALADPTGGQASQISLSSSYQVPATDGRMVLATPLKFCLQFRPPTIAVVYTLEKSSKKHKTSGKPRKYIHSIRVDFEGCIDQSRPQSSPLQPNKPSMKEVEALCKKLCDAEPTYLNINIISKTQVIDLAYPTLCAASLSHPLTLLCVFGTGTQLDHEAVRKEVWLLATFLA